MNLGDVRRKDVADEVLFGRGYAVLKDFFDPSPLAEKLAPIVERHKRDSGGAIFSGGYRPDVFLRHGFEELMVDQDLLAVGERVLGDRPAFGSFGCNVVPPGSAGMACHLDYPYFAMTKLPARARPALCMQLIWYLCDVTEDLAPTVVVPGTQRRPRFPSSRPKLERLPVRAGSVCVSHGALWHGVSPNSGSSERPVLLGSYVPFWVQPMLNSSFGLGLSDGLRKLLRYDFGDRIGRSYSRTSK